MRQHSWAWLQLQAKQNENWCLSELDRFLSFCFGSPGKGEECLSPRLWQSQHCLPRALPHSWRQTHLSVHQQLLCQHLSCCLWTALMGIQVSHFPPEQCWGGMAGPWLCRAAGLRPLEQRVPAGTGAQEQCQCAGWVGCADGMLQWDVLWSLSSLHKEGKSCGQAAPTHLRSHQWHQMPLEEEEGVMLAVFASKHRDTGSIPALPKEEQHGVVPVCSKLWIPRCSMNADSSHGSFHLLPSKFSADLGVTFPPCLAATTPTQCCLRG